MEDRHSKERILKKLRKSLLHRERDVLFKSDVDYSTEILPLPFPDEPLLSLAQNSLNNFSKFMYSENKYEAREKILELSTSQLWESVHFDDCNPDLDYYLSSFISADKETEEVKIIYPYAVFYRYGGFVFQMDANNHLLHFKNYILLVDEKNLFADYKEFDKYVNQSHVIKSMMGVYYYQQGIHTVNDKDEEKFFSPFSQKEVYLMYVNGKRK